MHDKQKQKQEQETTASASPEVSSDTTHHEASLGRYKDFMYKGFMYKLSKSLLDYFVSFYC